MTRSDLLEIPQSCIGSRIVGLGAYRPDLIVTNDELAPKIDSSDEWIRQRTGIVTRRRAPREVSLIDMAAGAAKDAIDSAALAPSDIDAIIASTVTYPHITPGMAVELTAHIGARGIPAYDISAACAGYCYAVAQADSLIRTGLARNVLVLGAEKLSDFIDDTDRTISFLLGDGAGAAVLSASQKPGIGKTAWGSDGSRWSAIGMTGSLLDLRDNLPEGSGAWPTLRQDGPAVFRWAVWEMAKIARLAIENSGITVDDLAAFIPHQANIRIIDELVKQLRLPPDVAVARDIVDTGNTSAASIPLAMERLMRDHPELSGKLALQIGFGAGLVYAAQVVVLP